MQSITWNQQVVKKNNKFLVFQTIVEQEALSRADIAVYSGLNKTTVSSLVNELLEADLIYESSPGESSGGRRPVPIHFNQVAGYSVGIEVGVNHILGILTDLKGNVLVEKTQIINDSSINLILQIIKTMIYSLMKEMPLSTYGIVGIGIGIPGIVDKEGKILLAPNLGWKNTFIKQDIEKEFKVPVIIENEANAGAYAEKQFGAGQDYQNLIYVSAGIGIGVGIILNGNLYQGLNGYSGESGHMIIQMNGKPCSCGSKGCWEAYASENALLKEATGTGTTLESAINSAAEKNEATLQVFHQIGCYLGLGISNIINTFNPEQIIIGNRLAMAKEWLEKPIKKTIENHTLPFHQEDLHIDFSRLSIYSVALGVSAFAVENFIKGELQEV
ncbi:ROK family protein [Peribacillus butanolivorans]|uniref:ROK family protein n=1 Tax=Peribacillus butanolivorans TaxID=421767 RepID=UPI0036D9E1A1